MQKSEIMSLLTRYINFGASIAPILAAVFIKPNPRFLYKENKNLTITPLQDIYVIYDFLPDKEHRDFACLWRFICYFKSYS